METFSALLALCAGNSAVDSPHKDQWREALMFSLICAWTNGWVNNCDAGDLRRHPAHYDVIVMYFINSSWAHNRYVANIPFAMIWMFQSVSQFRTCHDSRAVVPCAEMWPVRSTIHRMRPKRTFTRCWLRAHELLVKWVRGLNSCLLQQVMWPWPMREDGVIWKYCTKHSNNDLAMNPLRLNIITFTQM